MWPFWAWRIVDTLHLLPQLRTINRLITEFLINLRNHLIDEFNFCGGAGLAHTRLRCSVEVLRRNGETGRFAPIANTALPNRADFRLSEITWLAICTSRPPMDWMAENYIAISIIYEFAVLF